MRAAASAKSMLRAGRVAPYDAAIRATSSSGGAFERARGLAEQCLLHLHAAVRAGGVIEAVVRLP